MRHLLSALILLAAFAATAHTQTVKALSYGTNGRFITGTNALTFSNQINFADGDVEITAGGMIRWAGSDRIEAETYTFYGAWKFTEPGSVRTNLGFSTNLSTLWTATNASNARSAVGLQRIWAYKSTNQTNATTNLVSDSALTFNAAANTKYAVELFLVAKASMAALQGRISNSATAYGHWVEYDAASQFAWLAGNAVTNRANLVSFDGNDVSVWQRFVIVAPTNSATVTFQFAPADTNGSAVIAAGSYLKAEVIE